MDLTLPRAADQTHDPERKRVPPRRPATQDDGGRGPASAVPGHVRLTSGVPARGGPWEDRPMVPEGLHDFFLGRPGSAGGRLGLLFGAISVSGGRLRNA